LRGLRTKGSTKRTIDADLEAAAVEGLGFAADKMLEAEHFHGLAKRHAWIRQCEQSSDWRLRLQLFLESPTSSRGATAFFSLVTLCICTQVGLMFVHSGSFSIVCGDNIDDTPFHESNQCEVHVYYVYFFLSLTFSVELFLRTISKRSMRELCHFLWWVDLVAIMPFYLNIILFIAGLPENWEVQALASCFRMLRLFKLFRLNSDTATLTRALSLSWRPLSIPLMLLFLGSFLLGSVMYAAEQIELGSEIADQTFPDVGTGVWFIIVTFSTVGYGDVYPMSHTGRAVAIFAIICGVLFMAMPLSIIGNNFTIAWEERKKLGAVVALQRHCIDRGFKVREITALFEEADESGDGTITYLEFRSFMDHIDLKLKPSEARQLFAAFDDAKTGVITFYEFCHVVFPDLDVERLTAVDSAAVDKSALTLMLSPQITPQLSERSVGQLVASRPTPSSPSPASPRQGRHAAQVLLPVACPAWRAQGAGGVSTISTRELGARYRRSCWSKVREAFDKGRYSPHRRYVGKVHAEPCAVSSDERPWKPPADAICSPRIRSPLTSPRVALEPENERGRWSRDQLRGVVLAAQGQKRAQDLAAMSQQQGEVLQPAVEPPKQELMGEVLALLVRMEAKMQMQLCGVDERLTRIELQLEKVRFDVYECEAVRRGRADEAERPARCSASRRQTRAESGQGRASPVNDSAVSMAFVPIRPPVRASRSCDGTDGGAFGWAALGHREPRDSSSPI